MEEKGEFGRGFIGHSRVYLIQRRGRESFMTRQRHPGCCLSLASSRKLRTELNVALRATNPISCWLLRSIRQTTSIGRPCASKP